MFAQAYGASVAIIVGSVVLGRAICAVCGGPGRWWAAPLVGLAALLVLADATIRLPGKGNTAAIVCVLAVLAAAVFMLRRVPWSRPWGDLVVGGVSLLGASIPFLGSGRVGPGAGIDNDLAIHLLVAEAVRSSRMETIWKVLSGYPTGPHSLVAVVGTIADLPLDMVFTGLLLAVVVLTALAAADLLGSEALWRRVVIGALCSLTFLMASFYGEGAFKETIMAGLLLGFVLQLEQVGTRWPEATPARRFGLVLPAGLLVAGAIYTYSYLGVAWFGATLAVWVAVQAALKPALVRDWVSLRWLRATLPWVAGFLALAIVVLIPILGDLRRFYNTIGISPAASGSISTGTLGNLFHPLSPFEALGVWWSLDFRMDPLTGFQSELSALALAVAAFGFVWSMRRRQLLLPAAVTASALIYVYSDHTQSPYVAAKALVIASPVVMAIALRALLTRPSAARATQGLMLGFAALFSAAAAYSTYRSLHNEPVQAPEAGRELHAFHHLTGHGPVLFLGFDDWAPWQLRASPVTTLSYPTPSVGGAAAPPNKPSASQSLDFDSVVSSDLDHFSYVITTNTSFASQAPANFQLLSRSRLYQLWKRTGPTAPFQSIETPGVPGAVLACSSRAGRRLAAKRGQASVIATPVTAPGLQLAPGGSTVVRLPLPRGTWQLSIAYASTVTMHFAAQGKRYTMPAYLGRPGAYFNVGSLTGEGIHSPVLLSVTADRPSFLSGTLAYADITTFAATRIPDTRRLVPLRQACGKYVDWYRLS